ncbi:amidohydrolase family protein [Salinibacterium sp. G-O1]|uniref:amidohydrolase family protein n=1 Tax=Salinibacterium sp. G-O1 TaxID=3046208 RepID=UPI0024BB00AD|nr:amidohydrolase family protein [Salinibacterium sp. G-O1]MDJ0333955.1 amidohydrolase family protein [Salinibacterium sp. G-O1]
MLGRALIDGSWVEGTILPGFTDSHVHLGLVDAATLRENGIARVLDLGWDPAVAREWPQTTDARLPVTDVAGPILTAPHGYPAQSGWAPTEASRAVGAVDDVDAAIAEVLAAGARVVKIALNSDAGPTFGDDVLAAVVAAAHSAALPVVAHTQGTGQAARALEAEVDALAHTPWTETLDDFVLTSMAARMSWISTLDMHGWGNYGTDFDRAFGNLERFAALGGRVHYGTDLGNGALPVGLNRRELTALMAALPNVIEALLGLLPAEHMPLKTFIPGDAEADVVEWLCRAMVIPATDIQELPA